MRSLKPHLTSMIYFYVIMFLTTNNLFGQYQNSNWIEKYIPWQQQNINVDSIYLKTTSSNVLNFTSSNQIDNIGNLTSPDGKIVLSVLQDNRGLGYQVTYENNEIIGKSLLGLIVNNNISLCANLVISEDTRYTKIENVSLLYGEKREFDITFNVWSISFIHTSGINLNIEFRVSNEGVALKYSFPEQSKTINFVEELTQFKVSKSLTTYTESGYESGYTKTTVERSYSSLLPLTLIENNYSLVINEAGNRNYPRCNLNHLGNGTLQTTYSGGSTSVKPPYSVPWRYILIGDSPTDLIKKKHLLYALVEDTDLTDVTWIKPGKVFRNLKLDTEGSYKAINFASEMGFSYVLLDAGWYGMGYGIPNESNPKSDPRIPISGLNLQSVIDYANQKDIGIILYINKVAWYNYSVDEILNLYYSWGVKGIKMGFMDGLSASGIEFVYSVIEKAAERQMIVNVHDNMRMTGMERYYPNLMTMEGIRGNEYKDNTGDHTTLLPFTRFLSGAADYTFCYKGYPEDYPLMTKLKTTKAHQLAIATIFYSPIQHIFWSGVPELFTKKIEIEYFKWLPTAWDDFCVLNASPGEYFSIAKKKGEEWFVAAITNSQKRDISIPLHFLETNKSFNVIFYKDDNNNSIIREVWNADAKTTKNTYLFQNKVDKNDELVLNLKANGGAVFILTPTDSNSVIIDDSLQQNEKIYTLDILENGIQINWLKGYEQIAEVSLFDLNGRKLYFHKRNIDENQTIIKLKNDKNNILIMQITDNKNCFVEKVIVYHR